MRDCSLEGGLEGRHRRDSATQSSPDLGPSVEVSLSFNRPSGLRSLCSGCFSFMQLSLHPSYHIQNNF